MKKRLLVVLKISCDLLQESLKNAVFVIPLKKGIQVLRQKINYKREIYQFFRASFTDFWQKQVPISLPRRTGVPQSEQKTKIRFRAYFCFLFVGLDLNFSLFWYQGGFCALGASAFGGEPLSFKRLCKRCFELGSKEYFSRSVFYCIFF